MLKNTVLKFGSSQRQPPLKVDIDPVTILVGPNNSGKSITLREIETLLSTAGPQAQYLIVDELQPKFSSRQQAEELLESRRIVTSTMGNVPPDGYVLVGKVNPVSGSRQENVVNTAQVVNIVDQLLSGQEVDSSYVLQQFLSLFVVRLDGRTRFGLTEQKPGGDLSGPPQNHLMALFQDEAARRRMREITDEAFGFYFVIDPTNIGQLRIRMSNRLPTDTSEEQSWDVRAREFHAEASDIAELSDGVKAFTGLIAAVLSGDYRIILVDEPEAFLHPVLARRLGMRLTELASEREGNVLAATHSPDFLMGCIQAGKQVNMVRLTYRKQVPSARLLPSAKLAEMMRDPLLRSTGVPSAGPSAYYLLHPIKTYSKVQSKL